MVVDRDWYVGGRNVLDRVGIGDLVELLVGFSDFREKKPERYAGYVASINTKEIGILGMHPDNKLLANEEFRAEKMLEIEFRTISHYRIIRKNDESVDPFNTPKAK